MKIDSYMAKHYSGVVDLWLSKRNNPSFGLLIRIASVYEGKRVRFPHDRVTVCHRLLASRTASR